MEFRVQSFKGFKILEGKGVYLVEVQRWGGGGLKAKGGQKGFRGVFKSRCTIAVSRSD